MNYSPTLRNFLILLIITCNIGCDQLSKKFVRNNIAYHQQISIVENHFNLTRVENTGAFLSLGNSLPFFLRFTILLLLPMILLFSAVAFILLKRKIPDQMVLGICFVTGGGIGNLYDRFVYGSVTDFLHLKIGIFQTGIFNLADVSIMIGMAIILWRLVLAQSGVGQVQN